jgi:hypothetical protein
LLKQAYLSVMSECNVRVLVTTETGSATLHSIAPQIYDSAGRQKGKGLLENAAGVIQQRRQASQTCAG